MLILSASLLALNMADEIRPSITFQATSDARFSLSHTAGQDEVPRGLALEPGSRLMIEHGTVELDFASGVRSVVRGPAAFTMERDDLIKLDQGRAWFDVPSGAVGFQVITPDLVLTDLGTRFGVISQSKGDDQAHVFTGKVELLNRRGGKSKVELVAGQARVAEAGGTWREVPPDPDSFLTKLPATSHVPVTLLSSADFTSSPKNQFARGPYHFEAKQELDGFTASAADKLVVTLSHENGAIDEVTFEGITLSLAVRSVSGECSTAIYYLDSPPPRLPAIWK